MPSNMQAIVDLADFESSIRKFLAKNVTDKAPYFSSPEIAKGCGVSVRKVTDKMTKGPFDFAQRVGKNWVFSTPKHIAALRRMIDAR